MSNGFLGHDASFMLDVVVCALVLVVPVLVYGIVQAKYRRRYTLHRNVQMGLAAVLLIAVAAFEVDLQLVHGGWENVVNKPTAAEPRLTADELVAVQRVLWVHLVFAISTPLLWGVTITLALRRYSNPPVPGSHSALHKRLAWASTVDLVMTSVTGLWFYYVAFVAPG